MNMGGQITYGPRPYTSHCSTRACYDLAGKAGRLWAAQGYQGVGHRGLRWKKLAERLRTVKTYSARPGLSDDHRLSYRPLLLWSLPDSTFLGPDPDDLHIYRVPTIFWY